MKQLERSSSNKYIAGVCGGLAAYFKIDPMIVRVVMIVAALFLQPIGLFIYPALWLIMPSDNGSGSGYESLRRTFGTRS